MDAQVQAFINDPGIKDQSLLYNARIPALRGQCVQLVCFWVVRIGKPVIWADAYEWWSRGAYPEHYEYIANTPAAVPRAGDIIIWDQSLPGSGGAGHIALFVRGDLNSFVSMDSNWGGKTAHLVTHNYNKVVGWLRPRVAVAAPAPAPAQQQGDEMITTRDSAVAIYRMLRPNGGANEDEINGTVNRRTFAGFLRDANNEMNARDENLRNQAQRMVDLQNTINSQNQSITTLNQQLNDNSTSNSQKQKALDDALAELAKTNAEMASLHDQIIDLQKEKPAAPQIEQPTVEADKTSLLTKILALLLKLKK